MNTSQAVAIIAIVTGGSRGFGISILIELAIRNCDSVMFSDVMVPDDDFD